MAENAVQGGGRSRRGASHALVVVGGLILVALVGVIVALVMVLNRPAPEPEPEAPPQRTVVVHEENAERQVEELINMKPVEPGYYQVSMTTNWVFPDGTSPSSNAYVRNRESNSNDVYFDILMRDTKETLYESPIIPLGDYINNITLDKDLDPGRYSCLIVYHLVDENQNTVSTLNMGLMITVEN
jgi:hypothetical protein